MTVRLSRPARRQQLMDAAADHLLDRRNGPLTMEGLAALAGVSKAVPYMHFDNADDVLVELYRREVANVGRRIVEAMAVETEPDTKLRAAIHAYFDVVIERGATLALLAAPGSTIAERADAGGRGGHEFVARLFRDTFGHGDGEAAVVAAVLLGALGGAIEALRRGAGNRAVVEETIVGVAQHLATRTRVAGADER